ncbi:MAG: cation-binding protein [Bacteroidetes bacterium HGW-Bacteroidetes-2]|jgi:iron-sulfur cluster repair protein YtfE (RIC family)|nr:MAG: cation-binding protein [Bacteroidetes bacterium HGW-Bacteroidetes-2]
MTKPIKRLVALQPWSKDHHHGLLLSWKIKKGFSIRIDPERIKKYTDWFWANHLIPHFATEEKFVFPILGNDNPLVQQVLKEHKQLQFLFEKEDAISDTLSQIETLLNNHIRFEERVLFNAIQEIANEKEIQILQAARKDSEGYGIWEDEFWI